MVAAAGASIIGAGAMAEQSSLPARELPPGPSALDNPLKGWAAYAEDWAKYHLPVSMAYLYVTWRELEPEPGKFAFEAWEQRAWQHKLAREKHVIFRVVIDYPGRPIGLPQWLIARGVAVKPYQDAGGEKRGAESAGQSPNYGDPRLIEGLERLIAAMGARYDANPRVAFIALGLLGHWGEWHTYPRDELMAPPETRRRVIAAYRKAFPNKKLVARYPRDEVVGAEWLGFHDDAFPDATGGAPEWHFLNALAAAKRTETWRTNPIGGEMVPNAAARLLGPEYGKTLGALLRARLSWLGPYSPALEADLSPVARERANAMVRRMGYDFRLLRVRMPEALRPGGTLAVSLDLANQGLAPFYYPWPVEFALIGENGAVAQRVPVAADCRRWLPGEARVSASAPLSLPRGRYRLGFGILDPWRRRPSIRFANDLAVHEGYAILGTLAVA